MASIGLRTTLSSNCPEAGNSSYYGRCGVYFPGELSKTSKEDSEWHFKMLDGN